MEFKMIKKSLIPIIVLLFVLGCTSTNEMLQNISSNPKDLYYLYDSEIDTLKKEVGVNIAPVTSNSDVFFPATSITNDNWFLLPFLVVNFWNYEYTWRLGQDSYKQNFDEFLNTSLYNEAMRSGNFVTNPLAEESQSIASNYTLDVEIVDAAIYGPFFDRGFALISPYGYAYYFSASAGPGTAEIKLKYTLNHGEKTVSSGIVEKSTELDKLPSKMKKGLIETYHLLLIECFCSTVNEACKSIVNETNRYINQNESDAFTRNVKYADITKTTEVKDDVASKKILKHQHKIVMKNSDTLICEILEVKTGKVIACADDTLYYIQPEWITLIEDYESNNVTRIKISPAKYKKYKFNQFENCRDLNSRTLPLDPLNGRK